ncbi:4Fe-4S binding protein [Desulfitispora alkaliphila]|uniref:4Fe-4S dicluster domain-containing protein n=1 Tax=Desulfitispora alkaliphila TaxID=622674 RepID=UPI003D1AA32D
MTDKALTFEGVKGKFTIFPGMCKGCGLCIEKCPVKIIEWSKALGVYGTPAVEVNDADKCIACNMCQLVCPDCAIVIEKVGTKAK